MSRIEQLILDVSIARKKYIDQIEHFTQEQAQWKPTSDTWCMVDITSGFSATFRILNLPYKSSQESGVLADW